jgi:ABC-type Fe3+-hydroxamate transport system substrate-binding protein
MWCPLTPVADAEPSRLFACNEAERAHPLTPRHRRRQVSGRPRGAQTDAEVVLGRAPDVFIPFDKKIPQTLNEGIPVVVARPQSEAAGAFGRLADLLIGPAIARG